MRDIQEQYRLLVSEILNDGDVRGDRTGTGTRSLFFRSLSHNLQDGFPLITLKKVHFKSIVAELIWMLSGSTNNNDLNALGCSIWNEWAADDGDLGPIYGRQWRCIGVDNKDQIIDLINNLINNPNSRRHVVSAWNVSDLPVEKISIKDNIKYGLMSLAPCHYAFQMYIKNDRLSCLMHMRSSDVFLGLPFNIAQYALLTHIIALECGLGVGMLHITLGDVHLYSNHVEQAKELIGRDARPLPNLIVETKDIISFDKYKEDSFSLSEYDPHPSIKAPVAV